MKAVYQEYLDYICQDVEEVERKEFLIGAMSSHLRHRFKLDWETAEQESKEFFQWRKHKHEPT